MNLAKEIPTKYISRDGTVKYGWTSREKCNEYFEIRTDVSERTILYPKPYKEVVVIDFTNLLLKIYENEETYQKYRDQK